MNRKPDIQYIGQFYVYGSEAAAVETEPKKKRKSGLPAARPTEMITVRVDLVAVCGLVVAVAMLMVLAFAVRQYQDACRANETMTDYVIALQNENVALEQEYLSQIDLTEVRDQAVALGMIPRDQAQVIVIHPEVPQREPGMSFWEELVWYFKGWFA